MDQIFSKLQKLLKNRRRANGIGVEYFPRIQYVAAQRRSQKFTVQIGRNTMKFTGRNLFMSMFNDISCGTKDKWRKMSGKCSTRIFVCKKIWKKANGHSLVLVLRKRASQGRWGPQRRATNRWRRTRKGPELACVQSLFFSLFSGWHTQGGKDELTSCRGTVQSAWQKPPVSRKGGRAGLPTRVSGRHVVRGRQSSPFPAHASRVSVVVRVRQGNRQGWWKRSKFRCWAAAHPGQDRRLPSVVTHSIP